jgi:hypothetical protein
LPRQRINSFSVWSTAHGQQQRAIIDFSAADTGVLPAGYSTNASTNPLSDRRQRSLNTCASCGGNSSSSGSGRLDNIAPTG